MSRKIKYTKFSLASFALLLVVASLIFALPVLYGKNRDIANSEKSISCTRYVSNDGNDGSTGLSDKPWLTLQKGMSSAKPGDTICLRQGVYAEDIEGNSIRTGTKDSRITLTSAPGETATVDGTVTFIGPDFWTISNIAWTNPSPSRTDLIAKRIVTILGGDNWIFHNNEVMGGDNSGLLVGKSTTAGAPGNSRISKNEIHDTKAANLYFNPSIDSRGMIVERNLFYNSGTENVKLGWGGDDPCSGKNFQLYGVGEVTLRYNTLHNSSHYGLIIAEPSSDKKIEVYKNLITSSPAASVRYDSNEKCLKDTAYVYDNGYYDAPRFSQDFGKSPANIGHESKNILLPNPSYGSDTNRKLIPENRDASKYGRYAP